MKSPQYWRQNKLWTKSIGKTGVVIATTRVHVATPERAPMTPYSYVIVDFGNEKGEFMGAGNEELAVGDKVMCVLRKLSISDDKGILHYGIKVVRY